MVSNTFKRYYSLYIEKIERQGNLFSKDLSKNSIRNYKNYLKIFYDYVMKFKVDIIKLNPKSAQNIIYQISMERNYKKNTANLLIRSISGFFKYLIDEGKMDYNPFKISISKGKNEDKAMVDSKKLTKKQVKKILRNCKGKNKEAILLMYCFGLRVSELNKISQGDFKVNGYVQLVVRNSKGNGIRKTYCIFKEYEKQIKKVIKDCEFNFNVGYIKVYINRLSKRLNLKFTAHSFRHSFADEYLNMSSATTLEGLKSLLGHSSIKTTEIYADNSEIRAEKEVCGILK